MLSADNQVPYLDTYFNNNSQDFFFHNGTNIYYGSFDYENWSLGESADDNHQKFISYLCWRPTKNLTSVLGSEDNLYRNSTLFNYCYLLQDYIIRNGVDEFYQPKYVPDGFLLEPLAEAYNYTNPQPPRLMRVLYTDNLIPDPGSTSSDTFVRGLNTNVMNLTRNLNCSLPWINISSPNFISANVTLPNVKIESPNSVGNLSIRFNGNNASLNWTYQESNNSWPGNNTYMNVSIPINTSALVCGDNLIQIFQGANGNANIEYRVQIDLNNSGYTYYNSTGLQAFEVFFDINLYFNRTNEVKTLLQNSANDMINALGNESNGDRDINRLLYKNSNQGAWAVYFVAKMYQLTGNVSYMQFVNSTMGNASALFPNGVYGERSQLVFGTGIGGSTGIRTGFDSNYYLIAMRGFGAVYNLTGNLDALKITNDSLGFISRYTSQSLRYIPFGAVARIPSKISTISNIFLNNYQFFYINGSQNPLIDTILNESVSNFSQVSGSSSQASVARTNAGHYLNTYLSFRNFSAPSIIYEVDNSTLRYIDFRNSSDGGQIGMRYDYFSVKTLNYLVTGSARGAMPSGGVISGLQNLNTNNYLIGTNSSFREGGLGNMFRNPQGITISNAYNALTSVNFTENYPYQISFSGSVRYPNQTARGTYIINYTLYDQYIEVTQTSPEDGFTLNLGILSSEDVGTGIISSGTPLVLNNLTVLAFGHNITYNNTDINYVQGATDIFSSIDNTDGLGSRFNYIIGIQPNLTSTEYFTDSQGRRLALPLEVSGTTLSKTITSSLTQSINATVVVNVQDCGTLSAEYNNADVEAQSCGGNVAIFNLENIPAGTSELILFAVVQNCEDLTSGSFTIILTFTALAILALALVLVYKWKEGDFDFNLMIIIFIAIIIGLAFFVMVAQNLGGVCSA